MTEDSAEKQYRRLREQLAGLLSGETDAIANAANMAAFLYMELDDINWAGFYFLRGGELVVGPFQGRPACVRIALGKGVCGTAAEKRTTLVIEDVDQFDGHIVCDIASRSEIAIPLIANDQLVGILDIDAPSVGRFSDADRDGLEALAGVYLEASDITSF